MPSHNKIQDLENKFAHLQAELFQALKNLKAELEASNLEVGAVNRRLELVVEGVDFGIWEWQAEDKHNLYLSDYCCKMLQIEREEAKPTFLQIKSLLFPKDKERLKILAERHIRYDEKMQMDLRIKVGTIYKWFRVHGKCEKDAQGQPLRMAGSISDIDAEKSDQIEKQQLYDELMATNEELSAMNETFAEINEKLRLANEVITQQAEDLVRQTEGRLQTILETLADSIWTLDLKTGQLQFLNSAIESITGYKRDFLEKNIRFDTHSNALNLQEKSLLSFAQIVHERDRESVLAALQLSAASPASDVTFRIFRKNGKIAWLWLQTWLVLSEAGEAVQVSGMISDITAQKEAELARILSEESFRQTMEKMRLICIGLDTEGKVNFVNDFALERLGYLRKEVMGSSWFDVFLPEKERERVKAGFFEKIRHNRTMEYNAENSILTKRGRIRVIAWNNTTLRDTQGKIIGTISIGQDVSEQRQAENEKKEAIQQLIQQNNNLRDFSYITSHNLRAPVARILGLTSVLNEEEIKDEWNKTVVGHLKTSAQSLDEVIKDLSKILEVRTKIDEKRERVRFSSIFQQTVENLRDHILKHQVELFTDFSQIDDFFAVKSYIQSIFFNLISNAIKYKSEALPIISIWTEQKDQKMRLYFQDNGVGIDLKTYKDKIFTLYQRFHLHIEGKGIGLYLVKTQVEALGGKIDIESEVGKGTTFKITFPLY
ncbi:PAS domain-containing sensor histidine kinase [Hugenholtzia roseola]|uniref:PAS domain-containing sensor histidine kinase n=1 Tax=Hugenholtzia roseola TaxID=1002 RepID=UPI00047DF454|nr:PAS domain-containing sensor histidine kinase [Hugenholtzia roseola]